MSKGLDISSIKLGASVFTTKKQNGREGLNHLITTVVLELLMVSPSLVIHFCPLVLFQITYLYMRCSLQPKGPLCQLPVVRDQYPSGNSQGNILRSTTALWGKVAIHWLYVQLAVYILYIYIFLRTTAQWGPSSKTLAVCADFSVYNIYIYV